MLSSHLLTLGLAGIAAVLFVASSTRAQDPAHPASDAAVADVATSQVVPLAVALPPLIEAMAPQSPPALTRGVVDARQARDRRVRLLLRALAGLQERYSEYSLGSANALIVVGAVTTFMTLFGIVMGSLLESLSASPSGAYDFSYVLPGTGLLVCLGFVVIGLVTRASRATKREPYALRIRQIKRELDGYGVLTALDVRPVPSGAVLTGTVLF